MLLKRVIACLDVRDGRVVKGVRFEGVRDAGDPVELAGRYSEQGADELVFLDIEASAADRGPIIDVIERTARQVFVPLAVGGGVRGERDAWALLRAGADKVCIQTAAVLDPGLITRCAEAFGSQCVVIAIDARRREPGSWEVFTHGGRRATGREAIDWALEAERRGAGEILLTSIDADGGRSGYEVELTRRVATTVGIPVIASGGAGHPRDLADVLTRGAADAALAASIFHSGDITIAETKRQLVAAGVPARL
ncbi:MAG: imidazole glycerol phosphate synthase subunit HisF [Candidatus Dormibacteraceae bacterium]